MNNNQENGVAKDRVGQAQEADEIGGGASQQISGMQRQVSGKTEEKLGDAKESYSDIGAATKAVARSI